MVDLGVGLWAWPLPMDYDHDGDLDLVVSCPDVPFRGTYLFENPGGAGPERKFPVFLPPRRLGPGYTNIRPSYVGGDARRASVRLLTPAAELHWDGDELPALAGSTPVYPTANLVGPGARLRANQWQFADFDGDGRLDLIVGVGGLGRLRLGQRLRPLGTLDPRAAARLGLPDPQPRLERSPRVRPARASSRPAASRSTRSACRRRTSPTSTATATSTSSAASSSTGSPTSRTSAPAPPRAMRRVGGSWTRPAGRWPCTSR